MSTPGAGIRERLPRRGRYLVPKTIPRRAEVIAAGGVVVVIAHVFFAQLTIMLALVFHATTKASRWRPQWLAAPAAAGMLWALAIGPANAVNGLLAGPRKILTYMAGVGGTPGRALHFGAAYAGMSGWLPRQLPLALITGATEAALAAWLSWLHTDEWDIMPRRPGLVYALRRWYVARNVRLGGVVTRDGACLGAAAPGSWTRRAPRLPLQQFSAESAPAPTARNSPAGWPGGTSLSSVQQLTGASPSGSSARDPLWARGRAVLSWQEASGGVLCAGSAGSGTTTTSFQIVHAAIRRRKPVIAVDLSGSRQLAEWFVIVCGAARTPLTIVSAAGHGYYEPLRNGDPARRAALVMGMIDWSGTADQYRRSSGAYLNDLFAVIDAAAGDPGTPMLDEVLHLLNPAALRARVQHVPGFHPHRDALIKRVHVSAGLLEADPAMGAALAGQLGALRASPTGRWLRPAPAVAEATDAQVDLGRVIRHRGVVLFSLGGGADARSATMVASLVAQDAMAICAELRAMGVAGDGLLWFDECGDIPAETLTGLVKRGPGADLATVLTTTSPAAADQLADHVNAVVMHRMADPVMAERFARLTGGRLVPADAGMPAPFGSAQAGHRHAGPRHAGLPSSAASPAAVPAVPAVVAGGSSAAAAAAAPAAAPAVLHADGTAFTRKPVVAPEVLFSLGKGEFVLVVKAPRGRLVSLGKTIPARLHVAPRRAVSRAFPDGRLSSRGVAVQAAAVTRQPLSSYGEDPGLPGTPPIQRLPSTAQGALPPTGRPLRLTGAAPAETPERRPWPM